MDRGAIQSRRSWQESVRLYLEMVRFSHTLFALPFALLALVWALVVPPPAGTELQVWSGLRWIGILLCMVTARNFAMSVNRWSDARFDAINPRTANRHIPSGKMTSQSVILFGVVNGLIFVASCVLFLPNRLPLLLSLPVLVFIGGYSFAKRFTAAVHVWLGAALMLAPVCTWIALRGEGVVSDLRDIVPAVWLGFAVLLWVAGFDMIYACQDEEVDRKIGLHSIASAFGVPVALRISALCHAGTFFMLITLGPIAPALSLGWIWNLTILVIGCLLAYEHSLVRPKDLSRVNIAFFHLNAVIGISVGIAGGVDAWLR